MCQGQICTDLCFKFTPKRLKRIFSTHWGNFPKKIELLSGSNSFVTNIKSFRFGKQSGTGRSLKSLKSGIEDTWRGIKAVENDQPEELSNAHDGFGHDDNKGNIVCIGLSTPSQKTLPSLSCQVPP